VIVIKLWYILPAILVFGFLIFIHEFGHYLCARACGVGIKEFAIGMGPRIGGWTSKKSGIQYSVRALPFGGYVSMLGEDEESDDERSFTKKKIWQRMLIILSGPVMNLVVGLLAMTIMVSAAGALYSTEVEYRELSGVAISEANGLQDGDEILKVGKVRVHTRYEVTYEIMRQGTEPVELTVKRDGETVRLENVLFPSREVDGMLFGAVDFYGGTDDFTVRNILKHSFFRSVSTVKMVIDSLAELIGGRYGMEALSGPVGMTQTIGESVAGGFQSFMYIFVIITMNLGVFNLLPIPALDGGRFLFLTVEAVIRRPINPKVEGYIHAVALLLLLGLAVVVTFNDIIRLF
jgi:regulator of sigma E protease